MSWDSITIDVYYLGAATRIPVALNALADRRWIAAFGEFGIGFTLAACNRHRRSLIRSGRQFVIDLKTAIADDIASMDDES